MVDRYQSVFRAGLFEGEVHLITGGGTGIGRCIAHELAHLGATVVLTARREEPLVRTRAEIEESGGRASIHTCDIRDDDAVDRTIATILEEHGRLDGLVNNAGGQFASPAEAIRPKGWRAVVDTNLSGTWFMCQAAVRHAMGRSGGSIVSVVADMWNGFPGMAHTGAARAGVVNLTKTLGVEWAPKGVRVNAVAPGFVLSSGLSTYPEPVQRLAASIMPKNPSARIGTEAEVSAAVVFLLSPAAAYITGETIRVDGAASLLKQPLVPLVPHRRLPPFEGFHLAAEVPPAFREASGSTSTSAGAAEDKSER